MKYRIDLHFTATISKIVDIENDKFITDEKEKFVNEYKMDEVAECLTYVDWDYSNEG
ncbi:MAG: hypothetical protein LBH43_20320 [Treponema sp.]|jgi:hypothetical protein|nr:hypothetical protein [Treponema sp.]